MFCFVLCFCVVEGHEILDVSYDGLQPRLLCRIFFSPELSGRILHNSDTTGENTEIIGKLHPRHRK